MKRRFTILTAAFALLVFTMPSLVAWGQTWELATSIQVGDVVVLVTESDKMELTGISTTSTKYGIGTAYQTVPAATYPLTVVAGSSEGTFAFKNESDYLSWTSGNSLNVNSTLSGNTSWMVSFDGTNATIKNGEDNTRQIWWNVSSPRFACYTGKTHGDAYHIVSLYKQVINLNAAANPTFSPIGGDYYTSQNVELSCTTQGATIHYSTTSNEGPWTDYSQAISVSSSTTIWAYATATDYNPSSVVSATYNILPTTFNQDWEGATNGWTFVNVSGDQVWSVAATSGNHYAKMSGYASSANHENEDWCISPAFDLSEYSNPVLTFKTAKNFEGNDLVVYFSNDYDGEDPTNATWEALDCTLSPGGSWTFYESGYINLSSFSGSNCYIGFKYTSTTSAASTWEVDDIVLESQATTPTITLSTSSINVGENNPTGEEISATFTVSQLNLTADITLSLEGDGDIDITSIAKGSEPTTVTWTYTPAEAGNINATVTATSTGAETQTLTITGAAFAPVTGYSIDFENEASLYTDWTFTNMMTKQTGNSNVNAHGGTYYGTTGGKATASVATKTAVSTPYLLTCYVTKQSGNTTASTWYIQVSEDGTSWTNIASKDATTMDAGTWDEFSANLSAYTNVYVRVYYNGSTAVRNIDDLTLSTEAPAVLTPTFSPVAGTYTEIQNVTITCATEGAAIYYTTDGTTPTDESNEYTEAITVSENTTIKAIAYVGTESSAVATAEYVINLPSVATPTFTPAAGTYTETQTVTIACETEGASILYKLTENGEWQTYSTALTISETTTVWAKATKTGFNDSEVATAMYTIAEPITSGTGTITFGNGNNGTISINKPSVTGIDNLENTWTITTEGTTSFTPNSNYSQVGSGSKPATSITFTMTLPTAATISAFEAKFGGFSNTAGNITLKVDETTYGTGALNGTNDVIVSCLPMVSGTVLTVTVINIQKGVKCYYISYTLGTETYTLYIPGYSNATNPKGGYHLIASPVTVNPEDVEGDPQGMIDGNFDLYYFDQAEENEWRNYEAQSFNLVPGKGYLYAHDTDVELTLTGTPYSGNGVFPLSYTEDAVFAGWNLIGNPYNYDVTVDKDFYIMNEDGDEIIPAEEQVVARMQGIFVVATAAGQTVTFSKYVAPIVPLGKLVLNLNHNRGTVIDRAIVRFGEGEQLPKFQLFENSTKLYIPQGNSDYAIVRSAAEGEMPVNFKAKENGTYTISVNTENIEMDYLHLIDNMTGTDVDLLQTPSYTFEASTRDYASRFRLVFSAEENGASAGSATFAYFNGNEWVVSNEGDAQLHVIDMTGRIVSTETINGNATVKVNAAPGVYMLRLVNGNDIKTQKVIIK